MNVTEQPSSVPVKTTLGLLPLIALSAALTGPAHAQQAPVVLDALNVQGESGGTDTRFKRDRIQSTKATAPLVDTPQTVTVVPEQVIEERGASDLVEVLRNTPGITLDAGENGFSSGGNSVYIRGMNATGSVFIDGMRDNGNYKRDTFNVEQVEVVKGAISDNGRATGSGYINMVTKTPKLGDFINGSTRLGFDDDGRVRARGTVDFNKTFGAFSFRLNGMAEGGDIFGREVADSNNWGVAPSLAYGLGTDFRAIIAYEHIKRDDLPDNGVPFNQLPPANAVGIPDVGHRPYVPGVPRDTFFGAPTDFDRATSDALLARFEYDLTDRITISNQTRWSKVDRDANYRVPSATAPLPVPPYHPTGLQYYDRVNDTLSNLTNIAAEFETGAWRHSLTAGVEFSKETSEARRGGVATSISTAEVHTAAAYINDTIHLTDQWLLTGGLRIERYSVDLTDSLGEIPIAGGSYSDSWTTLGGKLGIIYKPLPEGSIYASYGVTHLPQGSLLSNPDVSRTGSNAFPGFVAGADPVESHNYEIGVKWDFFGGDLSVSGALFRTEKKNVAYPKHAVHSLPTDPNILYGEQVIQGLELGIAGAITPAWNVFGGIVFLDTERRHGAAVDRALRNDYTANGTFFPAVNSTNGDELAFTPKVSASLWTTYRWDNGLTLGGGVQYVGESWVGRPDDATRVIPNGKFGKLPAYVLVNVMAAYEVTENITVRFNVDNLFDETYLTTTNWNAAWGYMGAPRTYRLGTSFRF